MNISFLAVEFQENLTDSDQVDLTSLWLDRSELVGIRVFINVLLLYLFTPDHLTWTLQPWHLFPSLLSIMHLFLSLIIIPVGYEGTLISLARVRWFSRRSKPIYLCIHHQFIPNSLVTAIGDAYVVDIVGTSLSLKSNISFYSLMILLLN